MTTTNHTPHIGDACDCAFEEGKTAALKGDDWTQCRYSVQSPLFGAWKQGFETVRQWK